MVGHGVVSSIVANPQVTIYVGFGISFTAIVATEITPIIK
jgi:hypothetical protein